MKFVLGMILTLASANSFAWEADNSKNLSDVLFVSNAGRLYGRTEMTWVSLAGEVGVTGGDLDFTSQQNLIKQVLGYGISDRLQVSLTYQNQLKGLNSIEQNGNSSNEGPANPELGVLYRLLQQADDTVTLDLFAGYAPDMIDSESNSTKDESDFAAGGSSLLLGVRAGKKFTNLEMMGSITIEANSDSESEDTQTKEKTKQDSNSEVSIAYWVQFPLQNSFWARARLENTATSETKTKFSDGSSSKRDGSSTVELAGSLLYSPIDQHLVFEAGLGLLGASDFKVKDSSGTQNKYKDLGGSRLFLAATYQF